MQKAQFRLFFEMYKKFSTAGKDSTSLKNGEYDLKYVLLAWKNKKKYARPVVYKFLN